MTTANEYFVGIDVSKEKLDIAVLGESAVMQAANDKTGIMDLRKKLLELKPELIVVEATGGYEEALVLDLFEAGLRLALVSRGTGKGGTWLTKQPDAESAVWGRFPESVGERPHLSGARGLGAFLP